MSERQQAYIRDTKTQTDAYIRDVAGKSPADSIADAKALLDSGTITQQEFDRLKAKGLSVILVLDFCGRKYFNDDGSQS